MRFIVVRTRSMSKGICLVLSAAGLMSFSGCLTDSEEKLPDPRQVSAESIKSLSVNGRTISATVVYLTPESCWGFVRADHSISGPTITVTVFARRLTNNPCLQVLTPVDAPLSLIVPGPGTYTLKFWRQPDGSLDTTVTVP